MGGQISVLLVDDDEQFLELVDDALQMAHITVHTATNGRDGLKLAREHKPDVILLDVTMPEMDGLAVLNELKNDDETAGVPVFMLTGQSITDEAKQTFDAAADFISKPVQLMRLAALIKTKLDKCRLKK
ncbi:MAG: response regulator [Planctomycetota bacterium]|nr:MAG: response regulator [Planctomycetota bacterium]